MLIDPEKLANVLVSRWTNFIDYRELRGLVEKTLAESHGEQINKLSVSLFEIQNNGFLIWVEYNTSTHQGTVEYFLNFNGSVIRHRII